MLRASRVLDRAEVRQFFRIIDAQADHMDGLIGDLLDAGRIDSGTLSVDPEPAEVAALVDRARTTFLSGGGRQSVRIDLPPDLPRVMADERRIVQVLNNLFSNASRHAPESSSIHVGAVRDGVHVAISVSDEGRGVPSEQLPHLFRKYADVGGGDRAPDIGGVGLGLAICKGLVEAHGGRIPGRERRARPRHDVHIHGPGGRRTRGRRRGRRIWQPGAPVPGRARADAHPRGGRRPRDAALRPRRARRGGLHAGRDRRVGGAGRADREAQARAGPAGPDAARDRRPRIDAARSETGRPAGHLHLGLRT